MIDIAALHRKAGSAKVLGKFFATAGYKSTREYLLSKGVPEEEIVSRTQAYRGAVGISKVHPLVVIEYLRWCHFPTYAKWVLSKVREEAADE